MSWSMMRCWVKDLPEPVIPLRMMNPLALATVFGSVGYDQENDGFELARPLSVGIGLCAILHNDTVQVVQIVPDTIS